MELAKGVVEIQVGIADYKVAVSPKRLITLGLGSCVGVALYDSNSRVGGLLHIMLPDSTQFSNVNKPAKFADLGIPLMIQEIRKLGGNPSRLTAKLAGGAQMFSGLDEKFVLNIGQRNSAMVKQVLAKLSIPVLAQELGGNRGRTMIFDTTNGQVTIRTIGTPLKVI
ncbi:chemotaxis protein CheD [Desulforamulus aquiferis]|uniref:Probable chemoreceptor glutamine deamidase CheD n=1 Tax=Desulforamulus aquiferis TaxID=1397668 RepID=A0AAW7ZG67_9FIRM|nr:chemotaxis protein CheD [Desulforamulus aquiferis]MDO7788388.1 chemotaxis protein CheD [Desulforamulus aquiferis]